MPALVAKQGGNIMRRMIALFLTLVAMILTASASLRAQDAAQTTPATEGQSAPPAPIRVAANIMSAKITHLVLPVYPHAAKDAHMEGTVILSAMIAKDGSVTDLQYVSGPPMFTKSAMKAVKKWKYRPTLINGDPVEVSTTISVVYTLNN
jgi:TonB family protein